MRKDIEIKLRSKLTGQVVTYFCHHFVGDSTAYYLQGVRGHNDPLNIGMAFNKTEWELVR